MHTLHFVYCVIRYTFFALLRRVNELVSTYGNTVPGILRTERVRVQYIHGVREIFSGNIGYFCLSVRATSYTDFNRAKDYS